MVSSTEGENRIKETSFKSGILQAIFSNGFSTISQIFLILIVPKLVSPPDYSYWQLYIFYTSYVGIFHFGWLDGMYLRLGGSRIESLDNNSVGSELYWFFWVQLAMSFLFLIIFIPFTSGFQNKYVILQTGIVIFICNIRSFFLLLFQATNHIHEYSTGTLIEKIFTIFLTFLFLIFQKQNFVFLILADVIGKLISLLYSFGAYHRCHLVKLKSKLNSLNVIQKDIFRGSKLLLANFASLFMIGVIRFAIKRRLGIVSFGQISIALSISNFMAMLIQAMSMVLFPYIRRQKRKSIKEIHTVMRYEISIFLLWIIVAYYPLLPILRIWLSNYKTGLSLLWIIFPIVFFDGKFELLSSVYLQALNLEAILYHINILSLVVSVILSLINYTLSLGLIYYAFTIIGVFLLRSIIGEIFILRYFNEKYNFSDFLFYLFIFFFMFSNFFVGIWSGIPYMLILIIFSGIFYKKIVKNGRFLINVFK